MSKIHALTYYLYRHRIIRFLFSGGMATATNVGLLFLLVEVLGWYYLVSSIIAFSTAILVSFLLQKFFTFNDQSRQNIIKQAVWYSAYQIFNLVVNTLFMYIQVDIFHTHYLVAQGLIIIVMTIYNFFVYKRLLFAPDSLSLKD